MSNLKEAEVGSRHDPYLEKVDEELTVISDQWPGLEDAVQQRLKDMNHDEDMVGSVTCLLNVCWYCHDF